MVLTILASVTILVVGLFSIVSSERQISASFDAVEQADLAIQAGLARASAMLDQSLRDETSIIFAVPSNVPLDEPRTPVPMLMSATYDWAKAKSDTSQWHYQPLVSGALPPDASLLLQKPAASEGALGYEPVPVIRHEEADRKALKRHPGAFPSQAPPVVWWETLSQPVEQRTTEGGTEEVEKIAARFCFHIEDLQGLLNLSHAGNLDGPNERHAHHPYQNGGPHVVPGLNLADNTKPLLNQSALFSLFTPEAVTDTSDLARHLVKSRKLFFTPDAWKEIVMQPDTLSGWPGRDASYLSRDTASSLYTENSARELEENTISGLASYDELALIPPDPAFLTEEKLTQNTRKLNLNRLLSEIEEADETEKPVKAQEFTREAATHIQTYLPTFHNRAGWTTASEKGYSLGATPAERQFNYLQCLVAGILDYADTDSHATILDNAYRGTDAFPVVSEQWQRYRFETSYVEGGSQFVDYSVTQYLELWNMTNLPINGTIQSSFECDGEITASAGIYDVKSILRDEESPDATVKQGKPEQDPDNEELWWHPPIQITLQPNEYRVIRSQPVVLKLRTGPPAAVGSTISVGLRGYQNNRDRSSKYRVRFGPTGQPLRLADYPKGFLDRFDWTVNNTSNRQRFNTSLPGMSYSDANQSGTFANNIGDPRAAFFIDYWLDQVNYINNSSPWSRNVRYNSTDRFFGENRINLWPDGGHNTQLRPSRINDYNRDPDLPVTPTLAVEPDKYVQKISNKGLLYSMTEIGHVFDPLMWDPDGGSLFEPASDMQYRDFADLRAGNLAQPSTYYCGGNTLRIGRPEHTRFRPSYLETLPNRPVDRRMCATALLDLFHAGIPLGTEAAERTGDFQRINGHLNINTATRDSLLALVSGNLVMDPAISFPNASSDPTKARPGTPEYNALVADEIIARRPFLSASELPEKLVWPDGSPLLGSTYRKNTDREVFPEWNDSAAEEAFARIFNSSTVRSRHFRVVVTGQCYRESRSGNMNVLATRSRIYHIFVRPVRGEDGIITKNEVQITYARNL